MIALIVDTVVQASDYYTFPVVEVCLEHLVALVDLVACKKVVGQGMMAELVAYHLASVDIAVDFDNFVVDLDIVVVVVVTVVEAFHAFEVVR